MKTPLAILCLLPVALAAAAAEFHVAPTGQDAGLGTAAQPFASLQRARDAMRQAPRNQPRTVTLHAGVYRMIETLELSAPDSGAAAAPVTWRAAPGETVRLTGGARLTDWQPVKDPATLARLDPAARERVVVTDLRAAGVRELGRAAPVGGRPAQLVCNRRYLPLARYPNAGDWLRVAAVPQDGTPVKAESPHCGRWTYAGDRPARWRDLSDLWVHGYWVFDWADQYQRVAKLDPARREITPQAPFHHYGYKAGQRFYFLNLLEELDSPGEWYLDRAAGRLYLWPPEPLDSAEILFCELDKPMLRLTGTQHVRVHGLTLEASRDQAVVIRDGSDNELAGCTIRNFGASAAVEVSGTRQRVRSCDLYQLAGRGLQISGGDRRTLSPGHNEVVNCDIHHVGQVFRTYHGAIDLSGVGHRVAHCAIHDLPHQGISYAGNDQVIEFCNFTRIAQETGDVGVTYAMADWTSQGHEFRGNYFHNVHGPGNLGCFTIYPDLPNGGIHLHHNVFYDVDQVFHTNSGRGMLVENNLFLSCRGLSFSVWTQDHMFKPGGAWRMVENLAAVGYDRPPYSERYPILKQLAADFALGDEHILQREIPKDNLVRRNVSGGTSFLSLHPRASLAHVQVEQNVLADTTIFTGSFDGSGKSVAYRNGDPVVAAEFAKRGNLIVPPEPGFADLPARRFRLAAESPARRVGFEPVPFDDMGLQRDEFRRVLPLEAAEPAVRPASRHFTTPLVVTVATTPSPRPARLVLRYTLDGSEPSPASPACSGALTIAETATLKVAAYTSDGQRVARSATVSATYTRLATDRDAVYLSDLPEQDLLAYTLCWKKDANYQDGPIRLGGVTYAKGLLLHPAETPEGQGLGRVTYRLDGPLRARHRFRAIIGIDESMHAYGKGSAAFIVEVHRGGQWQRTYESPVIKLGDKPREVDLDLAGADQLRLVVTDGGDGIGCDHATWAEARLK